MISRLGTNPFRRLRGEEDGLSMVEVMVALILLLAGSAAVFQLVEVAARTSYRAEQSQVSSNLLQREMERIKGADGEAILLSDSDSNTCMGDSPPEFADRLNAEWANASEFDGLEIAFADGVETVGFSPCEPVVSGDVTATVYRAIVWFNPDHPDPTTLCTPPDNPNDLRHDDVCGMKRIYVGVKPDTTAAGGDRGYREIQGEILAFTADANFDPGGGEE